MKNAMKNAMENGHGKWKMRIFRYFFLAMTDKLCYNITL